MAKIASWASYSFYHTTISFPIKKSFILPLSLGIIFIAVIKTTNNFFSSGMKPIWYRFHFCKFSLNVGISNISI